MLVACPVALKVFRFYYLSVSFEARYKKAQMSKSQQIKLISSVPDIYCQNA